MGVKSFFAKLWASYTAKEDKKWIENSVKTQKKWFKKLINTGKDTQFGRDFSFDDIKSIKDFQERVPVFDYEQLIPYINKIKTGEKNVLWTRTPLYFAKTSGTTSGTKYIPISRESMPFHVQGAKSALLHYINKTGNADFTEGKMIFLQGTPKLENMGEIKIGRLSGISAHYIPKYLQKNRLPSWETNNIEDWETKINKIVEETINENMTLISGIPPWLVMYFELLTESTGKKVREIFPNLQLLVTGGVNYQPYKEKINQLIGGEIDVIQTYPASEGFIGYQNDVNTDDLLLMTDHGIFYEFISLEDIGKEKPIRLTLEEIELGVDYSILLTTNAGLWAYEIGDTIRFVSKDPYKIIVTGRTKNYTSAFGEHVISYEVEEAMKDTVKDTSAIIQEFTLAPQVNPKEGLPYHEWFIEFEQEPENIEEFRLKLDTALRKRNSYYNDLITGKILRTLKITVIRKNGFNDYMKEIGKLGGQNKLPRLSNNRQIADIIEKYKII